MSETTAPRSIARRVNVEGGETASRRAGVTVSFVPECSEHGTRSPYSFSRRSAQLTMTTTYCDLCKLDAERKIGEQREAALARARAELATESFIEELTNPSDELLDEEPDMLDDGMCDRPEVEHPGFPCDHGARLRDEAATTREPDAAELAFPDADDARAFLAKSYSRDESIVSRKITAALAPAAPAKRTRTIAQKLSQQLDASVQRAHDDELKIGERVRTTKQDNRIWTVDAITTDDELEVTSYTLKTANRDGSNPMTKRATRDELVRYVAGERRERHMPRVYGRTAELELELDTPWAVVCKRHDAHTGAPTRNAAELIYTWTFCSECAAERAAR